ncbi:hypothetical protein [Agromyces bauzanensis]
MNTYIRDALRRAGGRDPSDSAGKSTEVRRNWRTTLAGAVVATMALGGMTALAAVPAAADELPPAAAEQAVENQAASTPVEEPAPAPAEEPAPAPAEEPAPAPAEESAPAPAEESAPAPAEEAAAPAEAPADAAAADAAAAAAPEAAAEEPVVALLVPPGEEVVDKVEICHATAAYNNPYVINEPAADGDVSGHAGHTGPIWFPAIEEQWGDIIPPFYYDDGGEEPAFFPGLNWDAWGQLIFANDCAIPDEPMLEIVVTSCVDDGPDGQIDWTLGSLVALLSYRVTIWDADDNDVATWTFSGTAGTVDGSASLAPGDYTITVEQSFVAGVWDPIDEQSFTIEECPAELAVTAEATGCSLGDDGTALVSISGLIPGEDYGWQLTGNEYEDFGTIEAESESLDVPFGDLPPGNYEFTVWWLEDVEGVYAQTTFFVEPCQPEITVVVTECPAYGEEGSALLKLSSLVEGVEYDVWVTAKGDMNGTIYDGIKTVTGDATHMAEIEVSPLAAGADYTAWVHGTWMASGGWGEVQEFELHASADFTLKPCPAAPAKPVKPAGLAVTGINDPTGPIAAALLLLGLGGVALVARARREGRTHHTSE